MTALELLVDFERHKDERSWPNNEWLNGDDMNVYVRRSVPRYINGGNYVTLDIASVSVYHNKYGRPGV